MYKIIPYIHYDNNLLPLDSFETDITKVTDIPINELVVMLDISREEISKKLGSMKWNGWYVFAKIKVGNEVNIRVNPYVLYRKSEDPPVELADVFIIKRAKRE